MVKPKFQKTLYATLVASESVHIFCCGLPTLFSILSVLAGMGVIATMPSIIESTHALMHVYEIPVIAFSGVVLLLGWGLYSYGQKLDCRTESACSHGPCEPKKDRTKLFLIAATLLFLGNLAIYFIFHQGMDADFHINNKNVIVHDHEHDY